MNFVNLAKSGHAVWVNLNNVTYMRRAYGMTVLYLQGQPEYLAVDETPEQILEKSKKGKLE